MFTGLIEAVGAIRRIEQSDGDARMDIASRELELEDVAIGDSIAVSGVCLTVTQLLDGGFATDISGETLSRSVLGDLRAGNEVNLEKSLLPSTRLGGHLVSGHVDGVGGIVRRAQQARSVVFSIRVPEELTKYIAAKGSISVDGISLTVNGVCESDFDVNIIPHTLACTTLKHYGPGTRVNLEVDIVARYVESLLRVNGAAREDRPGISLEFLANYGFTGVK
ncbi:MAG: riboflavin synthase [Gammaproteobacteria bacterium]